MKLTSKELIKSVTKSWEGKRDENSRPLVSKDILERMKLVLLKKHGELVERMDIIFNLQEIGITFILKEL